MAINAMKEGLLYIQSVGNKTNEIRSLVLDESYDLLVLSETWMNECDTAKIKEMTPMTHSFVHMPREDRRGGGVGLMIGKHLKEVRWKNRNI